MEHDSDAGTLCRSMCRGVIHGHSMGNVEAKDVEISTSRCYSDMEMYKPMERLYTLVQQGHGLNMLQMGWSFNGPVWSI